VSEKDKNMEMKISDATFLGKGLMDED